MASILNLTQHATTTEQAEDVFEPADKALVQSLLTFDGIPSKTDLRERANALARLAQESGAKFAMIEGEPYFMAPLEKALHERGIKPLYSFSETVSVEQTNPETGEIQKTSVFRHQGWVGED